MVKVGCCGFPVARSKYYSALPVVEIQQTFYEPPQPETALRWREEAPPEFEFTVKAWQLITHEATSPTYRRLRTPLTEKQKSQAGAFRWNDTVRRAWEATLRIARILRADKVLFQSPARFAPTRENRDRLRQFFQGIDRAGLVLIWEPRGKWEPDDIRTLCRELDLVHCVDPFKDQNVTRGLVYWRLHGIDGYRYRYTPADLQRLKEKLPKKGTAYCLFNNVDMWRDARRFRRMIEGNGTSPGRS